MVQIRYHTGKRVKSRVHMTMQMRCSDKRTLMKVQHRWDQIEGFRVGVRFGSE